MTLVPINWEVMPWRHAFGVHFYIEKMIIERQTMEVKFGDVLDDKNIKATKEKAAKLI